MRYIPTKAQMLAVSGANPYKAGGLGTAWYAFARDAAIKAAGLYATVPVDGVLSTSPFEQTHLSVADFAAALTGKKIYYMQEQSITQLPPYDAVDRKAAVLSGSPDYFDSFEKTASSFYRQYWIGMTSAAQVNAETDKVITQRTAPTFFDQVGAAVPLAALAVAAVIVAPAIISAVSGSSVPTLAADGAVTTSAATAPAVITTAPLGVSTVADTASLMGAGSSVNVAASGGVINLGASSASSISALTTAVATPVDAFAALSAPLASTGVASVDVALAGSTINLVNSSVLMNGAVNPIAATLGNMPTLADSIVNQVQNALPSPSSLASSAVSKVTAAGLAALSGAILPQAKKATTAAIPQAPQTNSLTNLLSNPIVLAIGAFLLIKGAK